MKATMSTLLRAGVALVFMVGNGSLSTAADSTLGTKAANRKVVAITDLFPRMPKSLDSDEPNLTAIPVTSDGNVAISLARKSTCRFGDLDAIYADVAASKEGSLLLSVECLDCDAKPVTAAIGPDLFLKPSVELALQLPNPEKPHVFGLFLCKDNGGAHSCKNKPVLGIDQVIAGHSPSQAEKKAQTDFVEPDKVYYFAHLVLGGGKSLLFQNRHGISERKKVPEALSRSGVAPADVATATTELNRFHDTLGSIPPAVKNSSVHIQLPYYDDAGCRLKAGKL